MNAAAGLLITDPDGRVLLVEPTYKPYWDLPGGRVEPGESPHAAAQREVKEELGIEVQLARLLVVDYVPARDDRAEMVAFVFAAGLFSGAITVDGDEISRWGWTTGLERLDLVRPHAPILERRIGAAIVAQYTGLTSYLESGMPT
ncbi:MAG TPA: NUDIX hydrolase [Micromonosporaceae bacterium]|nr:NUDIX hydrolase [Micromonosporaceae bacterium]